MYNGGTPELVAEALGIKCVAAPKPLTPSWTWTDVSTSVEKYLGVTTTEAAICGAVLAGVAVVALLRRR